MSSFAIKYPFFILMFCLMVVVVGITTVARMPVDLFPEINIPVVVVATFYSGMPPQQIEADITDSYERFFTLGSNINHIESRSLPGVSLIKIYFQPGTDANSAVSNISNLAMANLRRLAAGDAAAGGAEVRRVEPAGVPGHAGRPGLERDAIARTWRSSRCATRSRTFRAPPCRNRMAAPIARSRFMLIPVKLEAHQLSVMDVVRSVNESNLILPAGDVRIGTKDYNIYANSQVPVVDEINAMPIKTDKQGQVGENVLVGDVGKAEDAGQLQYNIVRVDGQHSVYIPVLKQGGGSNTISIVNGIRAAVSHLLDIPSALKTNVVFDQSAFVKLAVKNVINEGTMGLLLTALMILLFLGNVRATISVLLSIPISCLVTFLALSMGASTINTMVLGGLALALSRIIDNSVVVLENIFRHMEMGEDPIVASERGGKEVELALLAITCSTSIVFFPVLLLFGVSKYLFTALALAVVLALFASYIVAMTVVPLFCAKFIRIDASHTHPTVEAREEDLAAAEESQTQPSLFRRVVERFNHQFQRLLEGYNRGVAFSLKRPVLVVGGSMLIVLLGVMLYPAMGKAFFPRTDPGQFVVNVKVPPGTRIEVSDEYVAKMEDDIRKVVSADDMNMIVSNIGITPDLSAIYTSNSGMHTAFIQVSLKEDHKTSSYIYMQRLRERFAQDFPEVNTYFQTGGLVDSVVNQGQPAPTRYSHRRQRSGQALCVRADAGGKIDGAEFGGRCADSPGPRLPRTGT